MNIAAQAENYYNTQWNTFVFMNDNFYNLKPARYIASVLVLQSGVSLTCFRREAATKGLRE